MSTALRIVVSLIVGIVAVVSMVAYQQSTGSQSKPQVVGAAMIALVLAWVLSGFKGRS